jgi:hypothetical protein
MSAKKKGENETWSSLQSNGKTKQTGGVALTSCIWSNLRCITDKHLRLTECMRWQLLPLLSPSYWKEGSSYLLLSYYFFTQHMVKYILLLPPYTYKMKMAPPSCCYLNTTPKIMLYYVLFRFSTMAYALYFLLFSRENLSSFIM